MCVSYMGQKNLPGYLTRAMGMLKLHVTSSLYRPQIKMAICYHMHRGKRVRRAILLGLFWLK